MERLGVALITLLCVGFSLVSGAEVERRLGVRLGDDVTLYSDCVWRTGSETVWFRNSSCQHEPPLVITPEDLMGKRFPRYSAVWNPSNSTHDLLVKNVSESDLGLYYCAVREKKITKDGAGVIGSEDVYHYGNRTTRLSLPAPGADPPQTPSTTPPGSDCSVCWKLLVSVCPGCVLLSSVVSSTCVYCICRSRAEAEAEAGQNRRDQTRSRKSRSAAQVEGDEVCYASLDLPSRAQKRPTKSRVESSEHSTYSEVRTCSE